jgi:hypothetical protein
VIGFVCEHGSLHTDCPAYVNAEHAACAGKEHRSTFVAGHYQSNDRAGDEGPCGVAKVDHGLSVGICVANHGKNLREIVSMFIRNLLKLELSIKQYVMQNSRNQRIARPLCEDAHGRRKVCPPPHSWRSEHIHPRLLSRF